MHYRTVAATCLVLTLALGAFSQVMGQDKPPAPKPDVKKEEPPKEPPKEEPKDPPKEEPKKEEWLNKDAFERLMKDIKATNGKMRASLKSKRGAETETAANDLAKHAEKIVKCDLDVKAGETKGQKLRDQKDFKGWAEDLKKAAEALAKAAKDGKWDDAEKEKDKVGVSCKSCHDKYED